MEGEGWIFGSVGYIGLEILPHSKAVLSLPLPKGGNNPPPLRGDRGGAPVPNINQICSALFSVAANAASLIASEYVGCG